MMSPVMEKLASDYVINPSDVVTPTGSQMEAGSSKGAYMYISIVCLQTLRIGICSSLNPSMCMFWDV